MPRFARALAHAPAALALALTAAQPAAAQSMLRDKTVDFNEALPQRTCPRAMSTSR